MWYWLLKYILLGPLLAILGRPKVEGLEYVPQSGPVILASNHLAVADSFYLPLVVRRRITFLAKAEYFAGTGLKGWFKRWWASMNVCDHPNMYHAKIVAVGNDVIKVCPDCSTGFKVTIK